MQDFSQRNPILWGCTLSEKISILWPLIKGMCTFQSLENKVEGESDEDIFIVADLYETAPSPQEEMDREQYNDNIGLLCEVLRPFMTSTLFQLLPYWLQGYSAANVAERLGLKLHNTEANFGQIKKRLIMNYRAVLESMKAANVLTSEYYLEIEPPTYRHVVEVYRQQVAKCAERTRKRRAENRGA